MKKTIIILFLIIIFLPLILWGVQNVTGIKMDTELLGFSDTINNPGLTIGSFLDGSFQKDYARWFESEMPLRGVEIKTNNTLNYSLFNIGNRPIGKNGFIFEDNYIKAELSLDEYDYSDPAKMDEMERNIQQLEELNEKLRKIGKYLYVYIAPNKADIYPENIPGKYRLISDPDAVNTVELFKELISKTDIPYRFFSEMAQDLGFPPFYSTGIHWSRAYEQLASKTVIDDLKEITGKKYRNIVLSDLETSDTPYSRDTDVYDLLNLWTVPKQVYYQYEAEVEKNTPYDPMDILLHGDSFSNGLRSDILEKIPEDRVYWINRDHETIDAAGRYSVLHGDFNNIDWQKYLDGSDVIVIEMVECEIIDFTHSFVEYLNQFLDQYTPNPKSYYYNERFDANVHNAGDLNYMYGVYGKETGFSWIQPYCKICITNEQIKNNGLKIDFEIPNQIFSENEDDTVVMFANNKKIYEKDYFGGTAETIFIAPDSLNSTGDEYVFEIFCSQSFVPRDMGINEDTRDLALRLIYLGDAS